MADAPTRHEATDEELRAAFVRCRQFARSPWPVSFEAAMADGVLAQLVHLETRRPRSAAPAAAPPPPAPVPHPESHAPAQRWLFRPPEPGAIDIKRAASGDRDDD